ncbi:MAG: methylenetetrahydrofolate reductase C-terminal domain-containing protein [Thermoleophilia bacterium]|nr:methylenetetrahydrofolate reductase C-terminal domain-containing protein [Thermoleophilia bacterium]
MNITKQKPFEEILESLANDTNIYIVGCGECATQTQTGGEEQVADIQARLQEAGKTIVATDVAHSTCHELDMKRIFRQNKAAAATADAFLVLSCGGGVQSVREATSKHVVPGADSLFVGNTKRNMVFEEKCSLCGECVLDEYGAICPVTRCAKGILNGPCGGTNMGKCEVDSEKDCAWVLIYNQLKSEDKLDKFMKIHSPKRWNAVERPGRINGRTADEEKGAA